MIDGKGTGFGNNISIQTVAIIKAALALRRVYAVDEGRPVCAHTPSNATSVLYIPCLILISLPTTTTTNSTSLKAI